MLNIKLFYILQDTSTIVPEFYTTLSNQLAQFHITTVPLSFSEFNAITQKSPLSHVFIDTLNLTSKSFLQNIMLQKLYTALLHSKLRLFHLSSFDPPIKLGRFIKSKKYFIFRAPLKMEDLTHRLAYAILEELSTDQSWPGKKGNAPYKILFQKKDARL